MQEDKLWDAMHRLTTLTKKFVHTNGPLDGMPMEDDTTPPPRTTPHLPKIVDYSQLSDALLATYIAQYSILLHRGYEVEGFTWQELKDTISHLENLQKARMQLDHDRLLARYTTPSAATHGSSQRSWELTSIRH
jgi:hypothetical protein